MKRNALPGAPDPDGNALPIAPSMGSTLDGARIPVESASVDRRTLFITALALGVAVATGFMAEGLLKLIALFTNLSFHGRFSFEDGSPVDNHLGLAVVFVPVIGGIIVGLMARYGSAAIRGHGIPEAMEQVLLNQSRIPARLTFLKPVSSAIAIGTGGPFGAEGPIIATGGAMGSVVGQMVRITPTERKTLLAAGAAAGMAATFGSPVSAVLLAIELLLFEFRARSVIPVALASAAATAVRYLFIGIRPVFEMPAITSPSAAAFTAYILLGCVLGWLAVWVTKAVYAVEDLFEKLPVHWMWWPALGGVAVGVVGYFAPRTMGVGYSNISDVLSGGSCSARSSLSASSSSSPGRLLLEVERRGEPSHRCSPSAEPPER